MLGGILVQLPRRIGKQKPGVSEKEVSITQRIMVRSVALGFIVSDDHSLGVVLTRE